jgi:hypothetical protein
MRPYGVRIVESPRVVDIKAMGAKSSVGEAPGECGEYRGLCRGATKSRTRRYWKRVARAEGKQLACSVE